MKKEAERGRKGERVECRGGKETERVEARERETG